MWIRWRDRWRDTLDGKQFLPGNYEHYHACHYHSRACMAIRYDERNCHGQSSIHNARMAGKFGQLPRKQTEEKYKAFMLWKFGQAVLDELDASAKETYPRSIADWIDLARELYGRCMGFSKTLTAERLSQVYRRLAEKKTLELILERITNEQP